MRKLESYLKKVQINQKIMIFLSPLLLVGSLVFMTILPMQNEELEMAQSENNKLHSNIKRKAPKRLKSKIKKSKSELLSIIEESEEEKDSLNFLYAKLTNMEMLEFDERQWAITLDAILKESLKLNIKIQHIKNSDAKLKKGSHNIVAKKYVEIIGSANFSETIEFLNFIESRKSLISVNNIKMKHNEESQNIRFHINFTIYGVNI